MMTPWPLARLGIETCPTVIAAAGEQARQRLLEFFTMHIRSRNTDMAYARAVVRFLEWGTAQGWHIEHIAPMGVATYLEYLQGHASASTVRQHLAIIRQFFDWLVAGQVLSLNSARTVRGPMAAVPRGKIPV
jgi:site-specific recombinase XerD